MSERCEVCDRVECPAVPFLRMSADEYDAATDADDGAAAQAARSDCDANAVDWREIALAYRASHDIVAARATTAERERDALVEAVASWLETRELFPSDTMRNVAKDYERAWNNARHDAARQLRNGNWRKP